MRKKNINVGINKSDAFNLPRYNYDGYTDLALEERERFEENVEISGVSLVKEKYRKGEIALCRMCIKDEKGAKTMGKPRGNYVTLEALGLKEDELDENLVEDVSQIVSEEIKRIISGSSKKRDSDIKNGDKNKNRVTTNKNKKKILVVGLGNDKATPDALGPLVAEKIMVGDNLQCIIPGVFARTGMETYKIVKGIVEQEKPDMVVAVDSLAARNVVRVATTIQITDTGIIPGSGIGNNRQGLNEETLGVPVVALGVPMVVNSVAIVCDTMERLLHFLSEYEELKSITESFEIFKTSEKYELIDEIMSNGMGKMYVTPKDVDEIIIRLSEVIAQAINSAFSG